MIKNLLFITILNRSLSLSSSASSDTTTSSPNLSICSCDYTCAVAKSITGQCKSRACPILFRHVGDLLKKSSEFFERQVEPFKTDYVGPSDEIGKWGEFLDLVEKILRERDRRLRDIRMRNVGTMGEDGGEKEEMECSDEMCVRKDQKTDRFEELDRFNNVEIVFSAFCRGLMRWSSCITKRWSCITNFPHVVIHIPSMSYPCHLRCAVRKQFESLQNIQIGRLGWLVNENAQVVYVYPSKSNVETACFLRNFVRNARPDISLSRLWIIENYDEWYNNNNIQFMQYFISSIYILFSK